MFAGCCGSMVLEIDYVADLKVEISTERGIEYLQISGLCISSSLVVREIRKKVKDDEILILVRLGLTRKDYNYSGSFCYRVPLDENVNVVKFGNKEEVIWTRDRSIF